MQLKLAKVAPSPAGASGRLRGRSQLDLFPAVEDCGEVIDLCGWRALLQVSQDEVHVGAVAGQRLHVDVAAEVLRVQARQRQAEAVARQLALPPLSVPRRGTGHGAAPGAGLVHGGLHRGPAILPDLLLDLPGHAPTLVANLDDDMDVALLELHLDRRYRGPPAAAAAAAAPVAVAAAAAAVAGAGTTGGWQQRAPARPGRHPFSGLPLRAPRLPRHRHSRPWRQAAAGGRVAPGALRRRARLRLRLLRCPLCLPGLPCGPGTAAGLRRGGGAQCGEGVAHLRQERAAGDLQQLPEVQRLLPAARGPLEVALLETDGHGRLQGLCRFLLRRLHLRMRQRIRPARALPVAAAGSTAALAQEPRARGQGRARPARLPNSGAEVGDFPQDLEVRLRAAAELLLGQLRQQRQHRGRDLVGAGLCEDLAVLPDEGREVVRGGQLSVRLQRLQILRLRGAGLAHPPEHTRHGGTCGGGLEAHGGARRAWHDPKDVEGLLQAVPCGGELVRQSQRPAALRVDGGDRHSREVLAAVGLAANCADKVLVAHARQPPAVRHGDVPGLVALQGGVPRNPEDPEHDADGVGRAGLRAGAAQCCPDLLLRVLGGKALERLAELVEVCLRQPPLPGPSVRQVLRGDLCKGGAVPVFGAIGVRVTAAVGLAPVDIPRHAPELGHSAELGQAGAGNL
mmetsp:Transcript_97439/g.303862  ORF Transcript_97439/g.303862 Transcript_97439/m.303862 type:complete len:681 (+) Transcript_97439:53-2095(+)